MNGLLVELWMLKLLLVKAQKEMRNMLLENLREGDPRHIVTESLAELCPTVMWKAELVNDKIGRLAEETSKQAVESVAWWLLAAYIKCERKEIN